MVTVVLPVPQGGKQSNWGVGGRGWEGEALFHERGCLKNQKVKIKVPETERREKQEGNKRVVILKGHTIIRVILKQQYSPMIH